MPEGLPPGDPDRVRRAVEGRQEVDARALELADLSLGITFPGQVIAETAASQPAEQLAEVVQVQAAPPLPEQTEAAALIRAADVDPAESSATPADVVNIADSPYTTVQSARAAVDKALDETAYKEAA